jgi:hypothetical protein
MQAYKFDTKITEAGTIFLPYTVPDLYGMDVELFIVPKKENPKKTRKTGAKEFVSRWAGFLKNADIDPDKARYEYLSEKYK